VDEFGLIARAQLGLNCHTRRGKLNWFYLITALNALHAAPDHNTRWPWLAPNGFDNQATLYWPRRTVLAELGRVADPEAIRDLADVVSNGNFTATEAVRRIRAWRLDQAIFPPATADDLAVVLLKAVNQYAATHDGLTRGIMVDAMDSVLDTLRDDSEDDEEQNA
jgi:hypothetical protein